jgi:alpha-maltose-1-phosphate synthase
MALRTDTLARHEGKAGPSQVTAALYYHPEAYTTSGPKLMGRNAAGESFLRGFLSYSSATEFWVQVQDAAHARHFAETAKWLGRNEAVKAVDNKSLGALSGVGAIYFPGPGIGRHAWMRAWHGHGAWSLCGITHTTSSEGAMDSIADLLTAPVQPWDAVICTSTAVRDNVHRVLNAQAEYLSDRLGAVKVVLPQLPIIPLGIHTGDFVFTQEQRLAARQALGVDTEALVVLYTGRLSFHAKAHPLAMYQALQRATEACGKTVVLVECGWHANGHIANSFAAAAAQVCPGVRVVTLDGRKAEERQTAWAGADIFCSLSDNIQETFGIVPIEAMAAGLPVVVSDWDGYKDTVRAGIDGFRVPTMSPGAGLGGDLAQRHSLAIDTYDMYCGHACTFVAVDVPATEQAFVQLFQSAELRQRMGAAGRVRAQTVYDWRTIIPQYEVLWEQLAALRTAQRESLKPLPDPWPARLDPFYAFASYPTRRLEQQTRLALVDADVQSARVRLQGYSNLAMVNFAKSMLPSNEELEVLLQNAVSPSTAGELVRNVPAARQPFVFRALVWLVKLNVLRIIG